MQIVTCNQMFSLSISSQKTFRKADMVVLAENWLDYGWIGKVAFRIVLDHVTAVDAPGWENQHPEHFATFPTVYSNLQFDFF